MIMLLLIVSFIATYLVSGDNLSNEFHFHHQHHRAHWREVDFAKHKRENIKLVIYTRYIGYVNWGHPWFQPYLDKNCETNCVVSGDRDQVV